MLNEQNLPIDSVVMLTWSDWKTEPRSNRYHYATRFARHWPVYFVQADGEGDSVAFEQIEGSDVTLVHVAADYGPAQSARLAAALRERGVIKPLAWIYNPFFAQVCARLNPRLVVYHATEDYVAPDLELQALSADIRKDVRAALERSDLVVTVSEGVAASYRRYADYRGPIHVLPNGCDFEFWEDTGASNYVAPPDGANVALFQGGINSRLDYALLMALSKQLPDWQFWFCGKSIDGGKPWKELLKRPNVRDFGLISSQEIARLAQQSRVGLIPFKQEGLMRRSLPLKAYEYIACGLPVVTIPIDALAGRPDLFTFAETVDGFAAALKSLAASRTDSAQICRRLEAAKLASYDARFEELLDLLCYHMQLRGKARPSLNLLMLYDDGSSHVGTIYEHLDAFRKYSEHRFFYMPATGVHLDLDRDQVSFDFSIYDGILIHYSVRLSVDEHLAAPIAEAVSAYRGPKLLFIQDEYDRTERARQWIEQLGISAVFTNVPPESLDFVYPRERFGSIDFLPTLTGYVPEDPSLDLFATPMEERRTLIAYRGRNLPHKYGELGYEKFRIGIDMKRICAERGLPVDIDVTEESRIYGSDWYRFIGSARATLGTESGSNVFDFDGALAQLSREHASMPFPEFSARFLGPHEGLVQMNQVSPKIFEAIRLRTALVLFEGNYSGVIRPNEHFIALKKDYSNISDILSKLEDITALKAMTDRAYRDVIDSGRYSYCKFVEGVDAYLNKAALGRRRATIVSMPMFAIYDLSDAVPIWAGRPQDALLSDTILDPRLTRERVTMLAKRLGPQAQAVPQKAAKSEDDVAVATTGIAFRTMRLLWRTLPFGVREAVIRDIRALTRRANDKDSVATRLLRPIWRLVPQGLRYRLLSKLR